MNCDPKSTLAKPFHTRRSIQRLPRHSYPNRNLQRASARPDAEFFFRYASVVEINGAAGAWVYQAREHYGSKFVNLGRPMGADHLRAHLSGAGWLASRATTDAGGEPVADRVAFDLDLKVGSDDTGGSAIADLHDRYWDIRTVMGKQRTPLVYGSPGGGLRISYAISPRPLKELVEGLTRGLVADTLAAAGVEIGSGRVEIFPQQRQPDRLPLGRGMPILDVETLLPTLGTVIKEDQDGIWTPEELWKGLELLEQWRARSYDDLVEHLSTLRADAVIAPRTVSGPAATARGFRRESTAPGERQLLHVTQNGETCVAPSVAIVPGPALDAFVRCGVPAAGQRYATEFRVAMAFVASPERYPEFGLSATSRSNEEIARALTEWLARHHNGNSVEWREAALRGEDQARAVFLERYLTQDANRHTIVDRAREALLWERSGDQPTIYPGQDAFTTLLEVAVRRFSTTARRWSFVTWCLALQRASRLQALRGSGLGAAMRDGAVVWQLYSVWAKKWPGGSGSYRTDSAGMVQTAYSAYLQILEEEGLIELVAPHTTPWDAARTLRPGVECHPRHVDSSDPDRIRGECATYQVYLLGSVALESDLPYRPEVLDLAAHYAPFRHGKPMSIDEILHAAWAWTVRRSVEKSYGARQWRRITALREALTKATDLRGDASKPTDQLKRAT